MSFQLPFVVVINSFSDCLDNVFQNVFLPLEGAGLTLPWLHVAQRGTNSNLINLVYFTRFIQRLGAFPVELSQPRIASLRQAIDLLHDRQKLVIFPEGGIVRDQPLRHLKPGLARLILQAEGRTPEKLAIPIIPIGINYFPAASSGASVTLHINQAIYSQSHQQATAKQTAQSLTQALQDSIHESLKIISDFRTTVQAPETP